LGIGAGERRHLGTHHLRPSALARRVGGPSVHLPSARRCALRESPPLAARL
jgi:hypothetical protein